MQRFASKYKHNISRQRAEQEIVLSNLRNLSDCSLSSSSYPVYPAHRKLRTGSGERKMTTTHTHKGERDQRNLQTRERSREVYAQKR